MCKLCDCNILIPVIHNNKEFILDAEKQIYSNILYKYLYIYQYTAIF